MQGLFQKFAFQDTDLFIKFYISIRIFPNFIENFFIFLIFRNLLNLQNLRVTGIKQNGDLPVTDIPLDDISIDPDISQDIEVNVKEVQHSDPITGSIFTTKITCQTNKIRYHPIPLRNEKK